MIQSFLMGVTSCTSDSLIDSDAGTIIGVECEDSMEKVMNGSELEADLRIKAIALLSGGLDSTLAAAIVKCTGIEVIGLHIRTLFDAERNRAHYVAEAARMLDIPLRLLDLSEEHLEIVRRPKHGRGAGLNPCLDCRVFMLKAGGRVMVKEGAQFVVTGEVLGQRPMSQHRDALDLVAKKSGLGDRVFRPLSATFLPDALPVKEGWISREDLPEIRGRGRKLQISLAEKLGIRDYPQPAGGCLLVDKAYAARLRDAFSHVGRDVMRVEDFLLLRYGRHFRLSERAKVIVGRNENENEILEEYVLGRIAIRPTDTVGPLTLVEGNLSREGRKTAAALAARYCDHVGETPLKMQVTEGGKEYCLEVTPLAADDPRLTEWRIE
jgi:tRNA-specific 2-thiouridylase